MFVEAEGDHSQVQKRLDLIRFRHYTSPALIQQQQAIHQRVVPAVWNPDALEAYLGPVRCCSLICMGMYCSLFKRSKRM
ncbi:hypothetical protein BCY86_05215 [Pajaroellobacter abortibovis]|uniref:Uncharacterized protein n=1 Tax=Pajaroellobacter abortibovis TaxID=1882918 RepID=A0A1L6MX74_9BACT|nr:hypothetical protein BCY86_05215 [Pajaroellobacter abortibovis]